ncbi:hypothetical protein SEA_NIEBRUSAYLOR_118 [Mycobacterium phage NiebruSaylor]|uniref:Uncharacterized protein n=4 Tax=Viruses TaxID=10239 RepID=Q856I1_BPMCO|nr:gp114 [Mycobacterium phage Corndog]YP_008530676.1 hypothetical protein PBI_DYLAN_112 [Mycobacterium phage Dylan]YP_009014481.1 hypothetical protein CL96_gp118 [Mycobacterium phage Firecracker]ALA48955.1 hypothetical protein ZAKHE101_113 [Mycobacterium phage Zakhe101]QFP97166.1 hypothetical protein SEA_KRILI_120 [Mycobacterium phage Krili]QOC59316.1 hypothetical protein SEA_NIEBRUSAYLOR_118 [Mycobacterium phage NiebruSaylor]WUT94762.1 hypothetical protein SUAREZ_114 [Mycobacterium phage Sua
MIVTAALWATVTVPTVLLIAALLNIDWGEKGGL